MNLATFKLAKASGGCFHFAEVSVVVETTEAPSSVILSPKVFAWLKDEYGPDAWDWSVCDEFREGAKCGAEFALHNRKSNNGKHWRIVVVRIQATPADTTRDSVAFAACFAVWKGIDDEGSNLPYLDGRSIVFPQGQ
ncbi:MAG: hypothetical protein KDA80_04015 [Planctomycetaceae bacterium]|nr:hypothetical protein [Planctomycetaceae bacterium]